MIIDYLKKAGFNTPDRQMYDRIDGWMDWYKGKVSDFHFYSVYNGIKRIERKRFSLNMAKRVSEDWANLILNDKFRITADGSFNDSLQKILVQNRFQVRANRLTELTFALGTGAFVEYLANGIPTIDYIRADMIYPISWENGVISECAFAGKKTFGEQTATYIQIHVLENGVYHIKNALIDDNGNDLPLPDGIAPDVNTGSKIPLFQIVVPNVINNINVDSPLGISIYAQSIDVLRGIDLIYDSYCNEFRLGKKRIIVPASMARIEMQNDGGFMPLFDSNDTEFYAMVGMDDDLHDIKEINMNLRINEHDMGLQRNLNLLSSKCGLGNERYSVQRVGKRTATEVVAEKSDVYQNLKKNELIFEDAIKRMVIALQFLSGAKGLADVSVLFDDALLDDEAALRQQALIEFQSGLIDAVEYHVRVYRLTLKQAIEKVDEINRRKNSL